MQQELGRCSRPTGRSSRALLAGGTVLLLGAGSVAIALPSAASGRGHQSAAQRAQAVKVPTPAKDPAIAALVPAAIKKRGSITVAMDATYPPDEFVSGNTIVGMDADFNTAIGALMGVKWNGVRATFDSIITGIEDGKYDVGNSSFTITAAREKQVDFVSYFQAGEGYYVNSTSSLKLNGLGSLCGLTVSVETGTTEQSDAQNQAKACVKAHKKTVDVLSFSDQNQANLAVSDGHAQLGFSDSQVAGYIVQQSHGQFKLDGKPFGVAPYGFALPKRSPLDKATLAAVKALMKDGIYTKILDKWGVQAGAITSPAINPKVS